MAGAAVNPRPGSLTIVPFYPHETSKGQSMSNFVEQFCAFLVVCFGALLMFGSLFTNAFYFSGLFVGGSAFVCTGMLLLFISIVVGGRS